MGFESKDNTYGIDEINEDLLKIMHAPPVNDRDWHIIISNTLIKYLAKGNKGRKLRRKLKKTEG